jgi:uncharacterized protein YndB with AHSA1/START domain
MESTTNTADRELRLTGTIDAPIELVWKVWANPDHIAKWWGPNDFTNTIIKMDMQPEGEWNLIMHGPDGTDFPTNNMFKEIVPFQKIVYAHLNAPYFVSTITFEAKAGQTFITWHMLFETADLFEQVVKVFKADEGLRQNIEKLGRYVKTI